MKYLHNMRIIMKNSSNALSHTFLILLVLMCKINIGVSQEIVGQSRIINGFNALRGRYPYSVSLQSGGFHFCGGSLIAPNLVLTAGHCDQQHLSQMTAVINPYSIFSPDGSSTETIGIVQKIRNPNFRDNSNSLVIYNDVLLLKLQRSSKNQPIKLNFNATRLTNGQNLAVIGWGTTVSGVNNVPLVLQETSVVYMTNGRCRNVYGNAVKSSIMCCREAGTGSCQGDSGGPLFIKGSGFAADVQVGLTSSGIGCAQAQYPGVYSRVSTAWPWIRQTACDMSNELPSYFNCAQIGKSQVASAPSLSNAFGTALTFCFPGNAVCQVEGRGKVSLKNLQLGDRILVAKDRYETVYSFGHKSPETSAEYVQLITPNATLELSKDHMVFLDGGRPVPASSVRVGDKLETVYDSPMAVTAVRLVLRKGAFAPFTASGTLIVNDIKSSSFVAFQQSATLKIGHMDSGVSYQWLAHTFEAPHRMWCDFFAACKHERYTEEGISVWVDVPHRAVLWYLDQRPAVIWALTVPIMVTAGSFSFPLSLLIMMLTASAIRKSLKSTPKSTHTL